jgi:predicted glycosyltransferase involved in capsule biosynthesis
MEMKQLSLIASVLESYEVVRRQLLHLQRILPPQCEFILVDDGSEPSLQETCDSVAKTFDFRLHLTHDRRPWTEPKARNIGASLARAEKLLFFDIDHIVTADILHHCLAYRGDKLHWVRRSGILDENGAIITDRNVLLDYGLEEDSSSVHSNSYMIRKSLFERLGGYDERFCGTYGGADIEFNQRYSRLCAQGLAKREEVKGEGYVFPNPNKDVKKLFHSLPR